MYCCQDVQHRQTTNWWPCKLALRVAPALRRVDVLSSQTTCSFTTGTQGADRAAAVVQHNIDNPVWCINAAQGCSQLAPHGLMLPCNQSHPCHQKPQKCAVSTLDYHQAITTGKLATDSPNAQWRAEQGSTTNATAANGQTQSHKCSCSGNHVETPLLGLSTCRGSAAWTDAPGG